MSESAHRPRILIVEDDVMSCALWLRLFESWGWEAVSAGDGDKALEIGATRSFDALVCDIRLPGRSGIEVIAELHRRNTAMTIIAISGTERTGGESYRQQARDAGAKAFLFKPVEPGRLRAEFQQIEERGPLRPEL